MFEDKENINSDLLMRSILENGQEEVPAHIWDGIASELDAKARRKKVALWWRRSAVVTGAGAIAAAVAAVLFLNPGSNDMDIVPAPVGNDMIAVVTEMPESIDSPVQEKVMIAEARPVHVALIKTVETEPSVVEEVEAAPATAAVEQEVTEPQVAEKQITEVPAARKPETIEEPVRFPDSWDDEEDAKKKSAKTSIVLSGLAGTNNPQANTGKSLMKRPSLSNEPLKTGVKETSTNSTYGIPVSFGAGVKIEFTQRWALSAGVNYSMLSRTFYGDYIKVGTSGVAEQSVSSDIRNIQHYVGIPVNTIYNILDGNNINFYAYAGGTVEKCVSNRYEVLSIDTIHKDNPAGLQFSANAGIGAEFMVGKHMGLYIDPSLRYYFNCNQPKSIRTVQPLTLGFEMGLRVKL